MSRAVWLIAAAHLVACQQASSTASHSTSRITRSQSILEAHILAAAARVVEFSDRFDSISLEPTGRADVWHITVDPALPSLLDSADPCATTVSDDLATVCHAKGDNSVACSSRAMAAVAGFDSDASPERPAITLLYVLAHELGHLELEHGIADRAHEMTIRGNEEQRRRMLRLTVEPSNQAFAQEIAADRFATRVLGAILETQPYLATENVLEPDHPHEQAIRVQRWRQRRAHIEALMTFLLDLDMRTRCVRDIDFTAHMRDDELQYNARRLVCSVLKAQEGTPVPMLRGSHPGLSTRAELIHSALDGSQPAKPRQPDRGIQAMELYPELKPIIDFMDGYYRSLARDYQESLGRAAREIRRQSATMPAKECANLVAPPHCDTLITNAVEPKMGSVQWTTRRGPDSRTVPGHVQAISASSGSHALALHNPDRVALWHPMSSQLRVAAIPCEPQWASVDGDAILVACGSPGGVLRIAGDRYTFFGLADARRQHDSETGAVTMRWVGRINGRVLVSGQFGRGSYQQFLAEWANDQVEELGVAKGADCFSILNGPHRLQTDPRRPGILAFPFHDSERGYVLNHDGSKLTAEIDPWDWVTVSFDDESEPAKPHQCRESYFQRPGSDVFSMIIRGWIRTTSRPPGSSPALPCRCRKIPPGSISAILARPGG